MGLFPPEDLSTATRRDATKRSRDLPFREPLMISRTIRQIPLRQSSSSTRAFNRSPVQPDPAGAEPFARVLRIIPKQQDQLVAEGEQPLGQGQREEEAG
jgi:hypothetical protein